jgi:glucose-1-phosphate thymidylyltransferase
MYPQADRLSGTRIRAVQPKGLICAGGEATRLGELTRVANKHLLPVGSWPMIYYPLQLLQLAGIREVLVVTGKGHAGQMIDLLGDGRLAPRGGGDPILDLDLTYKVQTEPGGIAQVVGMARDFAAAAPLVVVLGDNIFERAQSAALQEWWEDGTRARIFVKEVDDPENFGVVVYGKNGVVTDIVEKAGIVDVRYDSPPSTHAVVGLYCYPPDVFDVIARLEPSTRGELEITDVNRHYALEGRLDAKEVEGWWEDAGKHWQHLAEIGRRIDETGVNK